jgi:hypothetical protein
VASVWGPVAAAQAAVREGGGEGGGRALRGLALVCWGRPKVQLIVEYPGLWPWG